MWVWNFRMNSSTNGTLKSTFSMRDPKSTFMMTALVALPDNQHALSGSEDTTIKLFNVDDGAVLRNFTHHNGPVWCLALLPDGLRFVSGSGGGGPLDDGERDAFVVYHGLAAPDKELKQQRELVAAQEIERGGANLKVQFMFAELMLLEMKLSEVAGESPAACQARLDSLVESLETVKQGAAAAAAADAAGAQPVGSASRYLKRPPPPPRKRF